MCLNRATDGKNWLRKFKCQKYITCYKVLNFNTDINGFVSNIRASSYNVGLHISDRLRIELGTDDYDYKEIYNNRWRVDRGIHVYTTRKEAQINCFSSSKDIVVTVRCRAKDLVAYSYNCSQAVFMKVQLEKREHERALKRVNDSEEWNQP